MGRGLALDRRIVESTSESVAKSEASRFDLSFEECLRPIVSPSLYTTSNG